MSQGDASPVSTAGLDLTGSRPRALRGAVATWWALTGLVVTTFAFLGVNMFLSGLHSYGTL